VIARVGRTGDQVARSARILQLGDGFAGPTGQCEIERAPAIVGALGGVGAGGQQEARDLEMLPCGRGVQIQPGTGVGQRLRDVWMAVVERETHGRDTVRLGIDRGWIGHCESKDLSQVARLDGSDQSAMRYSGTTLSRRRIVRWAGFGAYSGRLGLGAGRNMRRILSARCTARRVSGLFMSIPAIWWMRSIRYNNELR